MLLVQFVDQGARAVASVAQEWEDELLLAVVVRLEEGEDVLVVVGDERRPRRVVCGDAPDEHGRRTERVAEDAVHGIHVGDVGTWCCS